MYFGKNIFAKKLLSIFTLLIFVYPSIAPPRADGFSFLGFGTTNKAVQTTNNNNNQNPTIKEDRLMAVLVQSELLADLNFYEAIKRYGKDGAIAIDGKSLIIPIPKGTSVKEIYEGLAHLYFMGDDGDGKTKLSGVILIGEIPIPVVEKDSQLWPTIFPYVDFEEQVYQWKAVDDRFVFTSGYNMEPEIWHGVIRSQKGDLKKQSDEILKFLDKNHKVHTGEISFADELFYMNTNNQKSFPDFLKTKYNQWLNFAEDFQYERFNKPFFQAVESVAKAQNGSLVSHELSTNDLQSIVTATGLTAKEIGELMTNDKLYIPDIQTEPIIRKLADNYLASGEASNSVSMEQINKSGAWDADSTDSTIKSVTRKDLESFMRLKAVNNLMETSLTNKIKEYNVPTDISVLHTIELANPLLPGEMVEKPLYWNGVNRKTLAVKDCTLYRGIASDTEHPYAQKVEANRTLNSETIDSCATEKDLSSDRYADKYEGCCANNMQEKGGELSYTYCDMGSEWLYGRSGTALWDHQGAELAVFDIAGTRLGDGSDGAAGCKDLLVVDNENPSIAQRFDSFMLHVEPTQETIDAQKKVGTSQSLPVDDPRGFSFYDHQDIFHRIDFLNIFDLQGKITSKVQLEEEIKNLLVKKVAEINLITEAGSKKSEAEYKQMKEVEWPGTAFIPPAGAIGQSTYSIGLEQVDKFTNKITWEESSTYQIPEQKDKDGNVIVAAQSGTNEETIVRFYEKGLSISDRDIDNILKKIDFEKLYISFEWLTKTLDEKNQTILGKALGDASEYKSFLLDDSFDGYELGHLTTSITKGETLPIGFDVSSNNFDNEFAEINLKNALISIGHDPYTKDFLGENIDNYASTSGEGRLATTNNGQTVVANMNVDLSDKYLKVSPARIFISKDKKTPIRVTFLLKNAKGEIDETNYTTEVALKFSSSDVHRFFDIFPATSLKVTAGEANFFLTPKVQDFGGELTLQGQIKGTKLVTQTVPIKITRYNTLAIAEKEEIVVNDNNGVLLKVYAFDSSGNVAKKLEGESLKFSSEFGIFQGGIDTVQINNGKAEILFFPGRVAENEATISVRDEKERLPDSEIKLKILPEEPSHLEFSNMADVVLSTLSFQDIKVKLLDKYDNNIKDISQEFTWEIENGEVKNQAEIDIDPRKDGIQEWVNGGNSNLSVRPIDKNKKTVRVSVKSSLLSKDRGISKVFKIIANPKLEVVSSKKTVVAGAINPVSVSINALKESGELLKKDFKVSVSLSPADFPHYKKEVQVESGVGVFKFYPGTKAGKYTVIFSAKGFEKEIVEIEVLPAKGKKLQLTTMAETWDKDSTSIPLDILVLDSFGNRVTSSNEKISLRLTEMTKDLVSIPISKLFLRKGKLTVGVTPTGKSGKAHFIVEGNSMVSDTLEISIEELLSIEEIKDFSPKVKFMVLSGPVGANLFLEENIGTAFLFAGNIQAISTMGVPFDSTKLQYGYVTQEGDISKTLEAKFVFGQSRSEILLLSNEKVVGKARMEYDADVKTYLGKALKAYGIYVDSTLELKLSNNDLYFNDERLLSFTKKGGIDIVSGGITLDLVDKNLKEWTLTKDNKILGKIIYNLPDILISDKEILTNEFRGIILKTVNEDIEFSSIFTGNSTESSRGFLIKSKLELAPITQKLGSTEDSVEETQTQSDKVWDSNWKPATLFSGGNNIGVSTQRGGSDVHLLLGDPTLSRKKTTQVKDDKTMGTALWRSPNGIIKSLSASDINEDGNKDLVLLVGEKLFGLYQTADGVGDFAEEVIISKIGDGVKSLASLTSDTANTTSANAVQGFVQINADGDFILHQNKNGIITKQKIPFGQKFEKIKSANLNGDKYTDMVGLDKNQKLWTILGEVDGFGKPKFIEDLSPRFDTIDELNTDSDPQYLSDIKVSYIGEAEVIDSKTLTDSILTSSLNIKSNGSNLQIGNFLTGILTISSPEDLEKVSFVIPTYKNLKFRTSSLNCVSCITKPSISSDNQTEDIKISNLTLKAKSKLILTWRFSVESLPVTEFFVGDFENGKDSLDDIAIHWDFGGNVKVLKFLSSKLQTKGFSHWVASLGSGALASILEIDDSLFPDRLIASVDTGGLDLPDTESIDSLTPLTQDNILQKLNALTKNSTSTFIETQSIATGAAGLNFTYTGESSTPSYAMLTGMMPVKAKIDKKYYRLYNIITTTGGTAIATCTGLKPMFMASSLWLPNCYVTAMAPPSVSTVNTQNITTGSGGTVIVSNNNSNIAGNFELEQKYGANKSIYAVDYVSQWAKDQWRYLMYHIPLAMPRVSLFPPDLTRSPSNDKFVVDMNKYEQIQHELMKYKFINIQRVPMIISIPDLDKLSDKLSKDPHIIDVNVQVDGDLMEIVENINGGEFSQDILIKLKQKISEYEIAQELQLKDQLQAKVKEEMVDYETLKEDLLILRAKNIELLENALVLSEDLIAYFDSWYSKNTEKIKEWETFSATWDKLSINLKKVTIDFFANFETTYSTNVADRGTWLPWLYKTLVGDDFKVITFATFPDTTVDYSEVSLGIDVKLADVDLKKVDIDLHKFDMLVSVPITSANVRYVGGSIKLILSTQTLPSLILPEVPTITIPDTKVAINLPKLPIISKPPKIPKELLTSVTKLMAKPNAWASFFGQLRLGIAEVPEWAVKPYSEQLTNRSSLTSLDFNVLDPSPINAHILDKETKGKDQREKNDFMNFLEEFTQKENQSYKDILVREQFHKKLEKDRLVVKALYKDLVEEDKMLNRLLDKPANEFFADKIVKNILMEESNYFAANNVPVIEPPQRLNLKTLTQEDANNLLNQSLDNSSSSELYLVDGESAEISKLINQKLKGEVHTLMLDLNDDGIDEVLYTDGPDLFVKYQTQKTESNVESEKVNEWTFEQFKSKREVAFDVKVLNKGTTFIPFDKAIPYYELFLSDRSDAIFELTKFPSDRRSKIWQRHGLVKQNLFKNYKIDKIPASVKKVEGSPKILMVKPVELKTYSQRKCENTSEIKTFFDTRSVLMAKEDNTQISIRVPALEFKPAEYQIIKLNKGESTSIDYGEVCVFSGSMEGATLSGTKELFDLKVGQLVTSDMKLYMNENNFVQLELADESVISIYDNDDYQLHFFDSKDKIISYLISEPLTQNLYGFLIGFIDKQRTLVRRKLFYNASN